MALINRKYVSTYKSMSWLMLYDLIFVATSLVDISCASFISEDAVVSLTIACSVHSLMFSAHKIFSRALRVIASRYFGAKNDEAEQSALTVTTVLSCSVALTIAAIVAVFGRSILGLFDMTTEQCAGAYEYLMPRLIGYCCYSFTNPIIRAMEAKGRNATVTRVEFINLLNVPLSLILMQFLGLAGIGLGTSLTEVCDLILVVCVFKPKYGKMNKHILGEVTKTGLSYLPECFINPILDTISANICLIYFSSVSVVVISEIVFSLYNNLSDIMYMSTQQAETSIGREHGANNQEGVVSAFKEFRHCYICILLWHVPISLLIGFVYFSVFTNIADVCLALALLFAYIIANIPYYIGTPASHILYAFGVIKPVMLSRMLGLVLLQIPMQYAALQMGADAFCVPISYIIADLPWCIVTVVILLRRKFLRLEKDSSMQVAA